MDENERLVGNAYRDGARDLLEATIAHATLLVMAGRSAVPEGGPEAMAAAAITGRMIQFWMRELRDLRDLRDNAVLNQGRAAPICGSPG